MQLVFIDDTRRTESSTRKQIRSHAAKGKGVGRREQCTLRRLQADLNESPSSSTSIQNWLTQNTNHGQKSLSWTAQVPRPLIDSVSVLNLPFQVPEKEKPLFHEATNFLAAARFTSDINKGMDLTAVARSIWVQLFFKDQAYYHCSLALFLNTTNYSAHVGWSATDHIARAYSLVKDRLSKQSRIEDDTIAVVFSLSSYDLARGYFKQGLVHIKGAMQMIQAGGGMLRLGKMSTEIVQKLYRADLLCAIQLGTAPVLDIRYFESTTNMSTLTLPPERFHTSHKISPFKRIANRLDSELGSLWNGLDGLCALVGDAASGLRSRLDAALFLRTFVWFGHRLLRYAPLGNRHSLPNTQRLVYSGLVLLIARFMISKDSIADTLCLEDLLQTELEQHAELEPSDQGLLLWVLYVGAAVGLQGSSQDDQRVHQARELMQALGLLTWSDVRETLFEYPWLREPFERRASAFHYRVVSSTATLGVSCL